MNKFRLALVFLYVVFFSLLSLAQPGNFEIDEHKLENCVPNTDISIELYKDIIDADEKKGGRLNRRGSYTIPVVFHIIHKDGPENISDAQVINALDMLNEDFSASNADIVAVPDTFKSIIGNANINFQLAQQAPNGSCTNGIERYFSPYSEEWGFYWTDDGQYFLEEIKKTFFWDVEKYLNIYVVNSSRNSGISFFPYQVEAELNTNKWLDGIMIRNYNLGNTGSAEDNFLPHVLSHEVGHYLNLLHAWGNWWYPGSSELDWYDDCNQLDENCPDFYCSSDDLVDDTPNCKGYNYYLCPNELLNTCVDQENDLPDNTQNMMDYSCMSMFSKGQVHRMHKALNSNIANRNNLWSEENLAYTLNCSGTLATQNCYQIYDSYIKNFDIVADNHGYLMTRAYETNIKARYKLNDGDWVELPETDRYYFTLNDIQKCSKYQFQISEKCGEIFSPWTNNRFFFTNGEDVPVATDTQFYTTIEKQDETAFNANDAYITVNSFNGTAPFAYNWSTGDTTKTINNIKPGKYYVTVTDSTCSITDTIVIERMYCDSLQVETNQTNQSYFNVANGNIEVTANGGVLPYSYLWSTGNTSNQIDSLLPGKYWYVLKDSLQCQITDTVKIDAVDCSSLNAVFNIGSETEFEAYNGFIEVEVSGGSAPYNYYWSVNDTTVLIDSLTVGNYTFMATDSIGCEVLDTLTVEAAYCNNLVIDVLTTDLSDKDANDATAFVFASGGKAPYKFSWSTGDTLTQIDSLNAGNYSVEVVDSFLCKTSVVFDLYKYNCNNFNVNFNTSYLSYLDEDDGVIQMTTYNGYEPLQILWSTGDTTDRIEMLSTGDYFIEVIDSSGCVYTDTLPVLNVNCDSLELNITTTNQTYLNSSNGNISIEVINGITPYDMNWNTGDNALQLNSLSPGAYSFHFEDAVGCTATDTIVILPVICDDFDVAIEIEQESFVGANDASANAVSINGTPPFSYYWSTGDTTNSVNNLEPAEYFINVYDAIGCFVSDTISVTPIDCNNLNYRVEVSNETYKNANDGMATLITDNTNTAHQIYWSTEDTTATVTNLQPGIYYYLLNDEYGCSVNDSIVIKEVNCSQFSVDVEIKNANCSGNSDGSIQLLEFKNAIEPVKYFWNKDTLLNDSSLINLSSGYYLFDAIDSVGCGINAAFRVSNETKIEIETFVTPESWEGSKDGYIEAIVTGGIEPYEYIWSTKDTTNFINNINAGIYTLIVKDVEGCSAITKSIFVETLTHCPESRMISNSPLLSSKTYQVLNFIESNAVIDVGKNVSFKAGNFISLNNGFTVSKGANFSIDIEECD